MFFHFSNFTGLGYPEDQARAIARVANDVIAKKGIPLTGIKYEAGECTGFSTSKDPKDTHVCIAIGMDEMGFFAEEKDSVARSTLTDTEYVRALEEKSRMIEAENRQLRGKS
jgi:phosphoribosylaminoimidazole-succinocarboxamide synthase